MDIAKIIFDSLPVLTVLMGGILAIKIEIARLAVKLEHLAEHYRRVDDEILRVWQVVRRRGGDV